MSARILAYGLLVGLLAGCQSLKHKPQPQFSAQDDQAITDIAKPVDVDVLANDGSGTRLIKVITQPKHGSARIEQHAGRNIVTYTPDPGFYGDDQFRYQAERGGNKSDAQASVHVRQRGTIRFSALIDERELVMMRGDELWFRHMYGLVPANVTVNGKAFDPGYPEQRATPQGNSKKAHFQPALPTDRPFNMAISGGPGGNARLTIGQQPTAQNHYTAVLSLFDPAPGAHPWNVIVQFDAEP